MNDFSWFILDKQPINQSIIQSIINHTDSYDDHHQTLEARIRINHVETHRNNVHVTVDPRCNIILDNRRHHKLMTSIGYALSVCIARDIQQQTNRCHPYYQLIVISSC